MGQVSITLNGRTYRLRCGDGEEARLLELAAHVRNKIEHLATDFGQVGDDRLMIMAALLVTDELFEARARLTDLQPPDPSLFEPLPEAPVAAETRMERPVATPPVAITPVAPAATPPDATKPAQLPAEPAGPHPPGSSLKRAIQRPQGKQTLSERLTEARETAPAGERAATPGRKAGNG